MGGTPAPGGAAREAMLQSARSPKASARRRSGGVQGTPRARARRAAHCGAAQAPEECSHAKPQGNRASAGELPGSRAAASRTTARSPATVTAARRTVAVSRVTAEPPAARWAPCCAACHAAASSAKYCRARHHRRSRAVRAAHCPRPSSPPPKRRLASSLREEGGGRIGGVPRGARKRFPRVAGGTSHLGRRAAPAGAP